MSDTMNDQMFDNYMGNFAHTRYDRELAEILKGKNGVERFNRYREMHPYQKINFSRMNFSNAYLVEANLESIDFVGTNLSGAQLVMAGLQEANLKKANLKGANLRLADLYMANLKETNLCKTNLTGAMLSYTRNLKRSDWRRHRQQTAKTIKFADE